MCGIAGFTGPRPGAAETLEAMAGRLVHRGPDDHGSFLNDDIALAIRRLSIIDVEHGHQPYRNEAGDVVAVFNGEIYGFAQLRAALARRGHSFNSGVDGEVIVHAYEEYGERFVDHLDGMFAIALWDEKRKSLLLARDRLGKKPLQVALRRDGGVSFASELLALLEDPLVGREVDLVGISHFLRLGYIPSGESCLVGVAKLPPGSTLIWTRRGVRRRKYWSVQYEPKLDIAYEEAVAEFDRLVGKATRARLVSDVPLGALLSGGMDSSYVVAHMVRAADRPVRTFTIGFEDATYDERPYARTVAEHLGAEHAEDVVNADDLATVLPELVRHYGEPYADSSAVATFYLARMARRGVTVVLTGDGGDELLGGYDRHLAARIANSVDRLPPKLRRSLAHAGMAFAPAHPDAKSKRQKAHRFFGSLGLPAGERFADWSGVITAEQRDVLAPRLPNVMPPQTRCQPSAALDQVLAADLEYYLPDDLLTKIDIATMACSLEARAPLLDYRVVEWTARLPVKFKQHGIRRKRLLVDGLRRVLPRELFARPKMGFALPVGAWLRGNLRSLVTDLLGDPRSVQRGWVDRAALERIIRDHLAGKEDHSRVLWTLLVLEVWEREILDVH
jgi:asparagine synthase (glutamine-hydrolysing)